MVASGKLYFLHGGPGLQRQVSQLTKGKLHDLLGPSLRSHMVLITPQSVHHERGPSPPRFTYRGVQLHLLMGGSKVLEEHVGGGVVLMFPL